MRLLGPDLSRHTQLQVVGQVERQTSLLAGCSTEVRVPGLIRFPRTSGFMRIELRAPGPKQRMSER
jgi:hypothetical protein